MAIENFEELLQNVLNGEFNAIEQWHQYHSAGLFQPKDIEKAIVESEKIMLGNNHPQQKHALFLRATMYHLGQGGSVNYDMASTLYIRALQFDNYNAHNNLAYMYQKGQFGGCDFHLMSKLPECPAQYKNSYIFIKTNDTQELYYIKHDGEYEKVKIVDFKLFEEKINVIKNKDETKLYLSQEQIKEIVTSNGGHTQFGKIDYPNAIHFYKLAISKGNNPFAMNNLAQMHQKGQGMSINYAEAIQLYKQAIKLGNASAMNNLARMYVEGQGVEVDYPKAIQLFSQAIELGNVNALNNLALMYQKGQGMPANNSATTQLYQQAIELGSVTAKKNLDNLNHIQARREQEIKFMDLIMQFNDIINGLHLKQQNNPVKYSDVYDKTQSLIANLVEAKQEFFKNPLTAKAFKDFKTTCEASIEKAEVEFKKHRDVWYQIHPVLRGILGVLATLTVIPGLVVAVASQQSYVNTFFSTPETNSQKQLVAAKEQFDTFEAEIEQSLNPQI